MCNLTFNPLSYFMRRVGYERFDTNDSGFNIRARLWRKFGFAPMGSGDFLWLSHICSASYLEALREIHVLLLFLRQKIQKIKNRNRPRLLRRIFKVDMPEMRKGPHIINSRWSKKAFYIKGFEPRQIHKLAIRRGLFYFLPVIIWSPSWSPDITSK